MVKATNKAGKYHVKDYITCKNAGIYLAECTQCPATYIGQAGINFSKRFNGHRQDFQKAQPHIEDDRYLDKSALAAHYHIHYSALKQRLLTKPNSGFDSAYRITFVAKYTKGQKIHINTLEDTWYHRFGSEINRQEMITSKLK